MIIITSPCPNELLHYTSYLVIDKYRKEQGKPPTGLYFNKIMSLAHRKLKEEGIDINLPHYWYRYGDQVHKYCMPNELIWDHENAVKTTVKWRTRKPYYVPDDIYTSAINRIVTELTKRYSDDDKQKNLIRRVYNFAPYDFQRNILELREIIYGWENALNWDIESYKRISKSVILNTIQNFPERVFPELKKEYKIFKTIVELILEEDDWDYKLFHKVCITFWFWFCYYLRLKANENIPKDSILYWESNLDYENQRYRRIIGDFIIELKDKRDKIPEILEKEYLWRKKDIEETKKLIDDFEFG